MTATEPSTSFTLYRCTNPDANCDYPFLGVAHDGSVLLEFGAFSFHFEWIIPDDFNARLAHDFAATDDVFTCNLSTVQRLGRAAFAVDMEYLFMSFSSTIQPKEIAFSLVEQKTCEDGPEYLVRKRGSYRRVSRFPMRDHAVTPTEQELLDACVGLAMELAAQHGAALKTPSPLSRRRPASYQPFYEQADGRDADER